MSAANKSKSILELDSMSVRDYFLKSESYCNVDLPPYYNFQNVLNETDRIYSSLLSDNKKIEGYTEGNKSNNNVKNLDDVNHHIYANKDGGLSWREFQIIHPLLYIHLLHTITDENNWDAIKKRFKAFQNNGKIRCLSVPMISLTKESDKAEQVSSWWKNIEQKSIELALNFDYLYDTDISDCYGSIYTHSIAWAIETKEIAKKNKTDKNLLGNQVDSILQMMQQGQTNGIPQGSNLMDFIAEIVLGYVDEKVGCAIKDEGIDDYQIIRYRDDYRVFVNSAAEGESILKIISENLLDLGMRLNNSKTKKSDDVVSTAIKPDKIDWLSKNIASKNPQHRLLLLREHSKKYPNSGTLKKELKIFYDTFDEYKAHSDSLSVILSIITDICYKNPSTYTVCFAIISKLLKKMESKVDTNNTIVMIYKKFEKIPNTGFMQIWFRRMMQEPNNNIIFTEKLCCYLDTPKCIWNNDWITNKDMKKTLNETHIVNDEVLKSLHPVIQSEEFALYTYNNK